MEKKKRKKNMIQSKKYLVIKIETIPYVQNYHSACTNKAKTNQTTSKCFIIQIDDERTASPQLTGSNIGFY